MKNLPTRTSAKGNVFTVADFYEAGREKLSLTLVAGGENLDRRIEEPLVNRPGLALTGFYDHFAWERIQVFGNAEIAYLESLGSGVRHERVKALLDRKAACFIFTNGRMPVADEAAFAARSAWGSSSPSSGWMTSGVRLTGSARPHAPRRFSVWRSRTSSSPCLRGVIS